MTNIPEKLLSGYQRFKSGEFTNIKASYEAHASTQSPDFMVISCCDSRVNPNAIFSLGPGDLYGIRNVANLVPHFDNTTPSISSALEHGINILGISNIVVLGHANCGGIAATLNLEEIKQKAMHIGNWIEQISHVRDEVVSNDGGDKQVMLEKASIGNSLKNLRSYPWIAAAEKNGKLTLIGAYFDIGSGDLQFLNEKSGTFESAASS